MTEASDPKKRFLEALEKKNLKGNPRTQKSENSPKLRGGQPNSGGKKMFRRKSGPS